MTNPNSATITNLINAAIVALSQRTDPLITRVNEGGVLTNAESKQVFFDMYKLTTIMKESAVAIGASMDELDRLDAEILVKDKEIALMKALLGLDDTEKAEN